MIRIRRATVHDADILAQLGSETWVDTYITERYKEGIQCYTASIFHTQQLEKQLLEPNSIFLIAEVDERPVGFAQMRNGDLFRGITGPKPIEIERFYVQESWFGKGVALHLMLSCLSYARQHGFQTIWLTAWKFTERARAFYQQWDSSELGIYYFPIRGKRYSHHAFAR